MLHRKIHANHADQLNETMCVDRAQGGTTAAHLAAFKGRAEALGALLAAGADACARDADGATPLHEAAAGAACLGCARALLAAGADPSTRDRRGRTPSQASILIRPHTRRRM